MDWPLIIREILTNSVRIALLVTAIIIPLMLGLALLKDSRLLDRAAAFLQPVMRRLTLSNNAAYPLLAGLFLGIIFGSGVILSFARDGSLTKRDLTLVLVFLGICHSIIEDTVVFMALGANGWVLISARFFLAALAAFAVSLLMKINGSLKSVSLFLVAFLIGCPSPGSQLPAPQKIGQNERTRTISGNQAADVINKMHGQSVAADANAIVEYGREKKDILYISHYKDQNQAGKAFDLMIEKMAAAKQGPFFHLMPLANYRNKAYFALGMGARHYIFVSGNYLLWLQTFQSFGGELPSQLLDIYPLASGPAGSRAA